MKHFSLFLLAFLAIFQSAQAQTNKIVATYIRAEEGLRVGTNSSQQISGFNTTIPAIATDTKLPTTKAVKDYVNASFVPLGGTASGDLNGTWPSPTVDGLQGVAVSATSPATNQVLKFNGTAWAPAAEADPSITNELQTISVSGGNITLSNGGGTIAAPTDGNGLFSGGTHTIPVGTKAEIDPSNYFSQPTYLSFDSDDLPSYDGNGFAGISMREGATGYNAWNGLGANGINPTIINRVEYTPTGESGDLSIAPGTVLLSTQNGSIGLSTGGFTIASDLLISVTDISTGKLGMTYSDNYSSTISANNRSIPDVGTIKSGLIPSIPRQIAESASLNGEMFYSTDASKMAYKNAGGTITYLW